MHFLPQGNKQYMASGPVGPCTVAIMASGNELNSAKSKACKFQKIQHIMALQRTFHFLLMLSLLKLKQMSRMKKAAKKN